MESLTEENVLEVVRDNYDSLTLKLHEGLDVYELFDSDREASFLKVILEMVVVEQKEHDVMANLMGQRDVSAEHQALLKQIVDAQSQNG